MVNINLWYLLDNYVQELGNEWDYKDVNRFDIYSLLKWYI